MPMLSVIRKRQNLHFIGVILFFVLHGYARNYPLVPVGQLLLLLLEILVAGFIVYWIGRKIFDSPAKAGLFTSFVLILYLFFAPFQNFFFSYRLTATFAKLTWFLPTCFIAMVIVGVWLKKSHRKFYRISWFMTILLTIYVVVECGIIIGKIFLHSGNENNLNKYQFTVCDTCKKINVYLIVTDEHVGFEAERQYLNYYDTSFACFLHNEGFYLVQRPKSNYALTPFSVSSFLNMRYHENSLRPLLTSDHRSYTRIHEYLWNNAVCDFFQKEGYRIVNYSFFNLKSAPAAYTTNLATGIRLITNETMYYRVDRNLVRVLDEQFHWSWLARKLEDKEVNHNELMMARTLAEAKKNNSQPTFTYVHLLMPHIPFAFDSMGRRTYNTPYDKDGYLQYLVYTDKRLTRFIQQLKQVTKGQSAIILMGDHGVRIQFNNLWAAAFDPLSAIYLPQKNYHGWYPGISHVNQFRVLFNTLFHQSLPMLPDSTTFGN